MDKRYIERFELLGYDIDVCTSVKEFTAKIKELCSWNPYGSISFRKYMNDEITGYYNCISEGFSNPDACIFIQYKDKTTYSYYPALGVEGKFKEIGIEWAIISHDYGYVTYKNDLSAEWEFIELDKDQKEAIELGISLEDYKKFKKTAEKFHPVQEQEQSEPESEQEPETEPKQEITESDKFKPMECTKKSAFKYKVNILEALKKAGYSSARIRKEKLLAQVTLQKFRAGDTNISLQTIADVCNLTGLQPWDILDFSRTEAN